MTATITIDGAGRIVLPKAIREELRLGAGDVLTLECDGEALRLRPAQPASPMRKEQGIWVFRSGSSVAPEDAEAVLGEIREGRDRELAGRLK
ncbi:MAG TPA: AbrB/MazE/SpoVT family DNA-binding domain-containing protein [Steroidobacteraceae bacterium]|nr:AbrB/MazE/SpoVT family DNA-binding domain-containing protein [Steroidobacteraceae bacterium]